MTDPQPGEKKQPAPLPVWARIGRIVAVVSAVLLIVVSLVQMNLPEEQRQMWTQVGEWLFNAALIGAIALFAGRFQSRR